MNNIFSSKSQCCGCTACSNICPTKAIKMVADQEGFLYPIIDTSKCIDCGYCRNVCVFQQENQYFFDEVKCQVFALKHKNEQIRKNSTSGGAFTAISDYVLKKNGYVCGALFDEKMEVSHRIVNTVPERDSLRGSKYAQSFLGNTFNEIQKLIQNDSIVLFTGTPCQAAGLKSYLKGKDTANLLLCDFVCHGVPSPLLWKEHIYSLEKKAASRVIEYFCRSKIKGWHGHHELVYYANGKNDYKSSFSQKHKELFHSNTILRPACHNCKYTSIRRVSDITIADFWGVENHMPDFDDNKGISLLIINSEKGRNVLKEIECDVILRKSNTIDCLQPQLKFPTKSSSSREKFWEEYIKYGYNYVSKKYGKDNIVGKVKSKTTDFLIRLGLLKQVIRLLKLVKLR